MSSSLLVPQRDIAEADATEKRREYAARARAEGTWTVYAGAWKRYTAFAAGCEPLSAGLVADYVIHLRELGRAASTIKVALAAIAHRARVAGIPSPTEHPQVVEVVAGATRMAAREGAGRGPADPLLPADIRSFVTVLKPGLQGQRDLALLLVGFAGGFRREELVRLAVEHIRFDGEGMLVSLAWSKGDQEGEGHTRRISRGDTLELCPVENLKTYLAGAGITTGPVFRPVVRGRVTEKAISARRVDEIVREYSRRVAKVNPEALLGRKYSAHSLRAGVCTAAALAGKPEHEIRDHVGHRSAQTTARYIRAAKVRMSNVTKGIGL